jgi:hypothetical protein
MAIKLEDGEEIDLLDTEAGTSSSGGYQMPDFGMGGGSGLFDGGLDFGGFTNPFEYTEPDYGDAGVFSGGTNLIPTFNMVQQGEGGGGVTTTDTTGNIVTLPNYVVNEPRDTGGALINIFNPNPIIGADSTVGRTPIGELSGAVPGISSGAAPGVVGVGSGVSKTIPVGDTQQTIVFDDVINRELNKEIALMKNQGISTSDPQFSTRLEAAANRALEIYNSAQDLGRYTNLEPTPGSSQQTGPGRGGPPIILPIAGLSPATAAILTAAGLIFSGGKIARFDPNNPVGSVAGAVQGVGQTGQNVIDVATGKTSLGEILDPGSTGAASGSGPTGTTPTSTGTGTGGAGAGGTVGAGQQTGAGAIGILSGGMGGGGSGATTSSTSTVGAGQTTTGVTPVVTPGATGGVAGGDVSGGTRSTAKPGGTEMPSTGGPLIFDQSERVQNILGQILAPSQAIQQAKVQTETGSSTDQNVVYTADETQDVTPVDPNAVSGGGRGGDTKTNTDTCPAPETPILLSDFSTIPAGSLKAGMSVHARLENEEKWGSYRVTHVKIVNSPRLKFIFPFGQFVCSPSHKFCEDKFNWREALSFKAGDVIQGQQVLFVEPTTDGEVVAITVDQAHTYVSGPFLSHNKSPIITPVTGGGDVRTSTPTETVTNNPPPSVMPTTPTNPSTTSTATGTASTFIINPITGGYTLPTAGTPVARNLYQEATTTTQALGTPMQQAVIGMDAQGKPIYGNVPIDPATNQPMTVSQGIASGYGGLARGMTQQDISNLLQSIGAQTGTQLTPTTAGGYQKALTDAAIQQTSLSNTALRQGNIKDAETYAQRALALRNQANQGLFGAQGVLPQFTQTAQEQVGRDVAALRRAEAGELSPEEIRNAQQAAREAYAARGQVYSQGAAAQEVLNRQAAVQQRQQLARQNLAQSMGQLGQGVGYQTANIFDPFATTLGAQYGMQTQNVGMNQALYNQAMGLSSGAGGYGFAQQMINPFSGYAQDVYGTNVNAMNAAQISAANRQAALEAAKMGQTGSYAQALGGLIASGGLGQIQSGLSSGVQGVIDLLSGKWPTK